jgi:hypothetical protein
MNGISQEAQIDDKDLFPGRESHSFSFNERRGMANPETPSWPIDINRTSSSE